VDTFSGLLAQNRSVTDIGLTYPPGSLCVANKRARFGSRETRLPRDPVVLARLALSTWPIGGASSGLLGPLRVPQSHSTALAGRAPAGGWLIF